MKEDQNTEWKESWRDEYLKHICAFANTQDGNLYIGINNVGTIIGIRESKKLLEDIPNKTINFLGICIDVLAHEKSGLKFIEIVVRQSSISISYREKYYVKSGSTKQELKSTALQEFIIKKMGKTFDELPVDKANFNCIDKNAVFKKMPDRNFVLVSNWNVSKYGRKLKKDYNNFPNIYLQNAVYNLNKLNCIRSNAYMYIHSHSQCGTAPPLVEAICLDLPILSFDAPQNRETFQRDKFYFKSSDELIKLINYSKKIKLQYQWQKIAEQYSYIINN